MRSHPFAPFVTTCHAALTLWVVFASTALAEDASRPLARGVLPPIVVDSSSDVVATDGICTLREAINNVNANTDTTGGDCLVSAEITFDPVTDGVPIVLTGDAGDDLNLSGDFDLLAPVAFLGNGSDRTIISGSGFDRVFQAMQDVSSVTFEAVQIRNGRADEPNEDGGGILTGASRSIFRDCSFEDNEAVDRGGAISNLGNIRIEVERCQFRANRAFVGGAIGGSGGTPEMFVVIHDSLFENNEAADEGGAIRRSDSSGTLEIVRSIFRDNRSLATGALAGGGGIQVGSANSTLTILDSWFDDNQAPNGSGGGLLVEGDPIVVISGTSFTNNSSAIFGGGIDFRDGRWALIEHSTFSGNRTDGAGGAISLNEATLDIQLTHLTMTNNFADAEGDGEGEGGGIALLSVNELRLENTILADNFDLGNESNDCFAELPNTFDSLGFNLIGTTSGCEINSAATDILGVSPLLAPVGQHGCTAALLDGSCPPTHPLDFSSPAIDQGSCLVSTAEADQRGFVRPIEILGVPNAADGCDIGAYEASDLDDDDVEDGIDNCPQNANPSQEDSDLDGSGDPCDLCEGNDTTGDADADGVCFNHDCDDSDGLGMSCALFIDGFETGDTSAWSVP